MNNKNLILIPARAGSKSIKNKNMRQFFGKPLIYWAIKAGLESNLGPVCVSTDSREIQEYAISLGCICPFIRPSELAEDTTPTEPVLIHACQFFLNSGINFRNIILLQPTSPFRTVGDICQAMMLMSEDEDLSSVFTVREAIANQNPHWMLSMDKIGNVQRFMGGSLTELAARRQDLPKSYIRNDYVYCLRANNLFEIKPNLYGKTPKLLVSDETRLDIDLNTEKDWQMGEILFGMIENHK